MTFHASVESSNGRFRASLLGAPEVAVDGSSREEALNALKDELLARIRRGEIVRLDVADRGVTAMAGVFADDPWLPEIVREAYHQRDLDRDRQFGADTESNE